MSAEKGYSFAPISTGFPCVRDCQATTPVILLTGWGQRINFAAGMEIDKPALKRHSGGVFPQPTCLRAGHQAARTRNPTHLGNSPYTSTSRLAPT